MAALRATLVATLFLVCFTLLPVNAWSESAPTPVATVVSIDGKGVAKLRRKSGTETTVAPLQQLQAGDKITTDDKTVVQITLPDGTLVRIGLNSEYRIDSARVDGNFIAWVFSLARGSVRALVEKSVPRKEAKFRINTPAGTMGVRGTEFILEHSVKTGITTLYTIEGKVGFGALTCEKASTCALVSEGEMSQIQLGGAKASELKKFELESMLRQGVTTLKAAGDEPAAANLSAEERAELAAKLSVLASATQLGKDPALMDTDAVTRAIKAGSDELAELQDVLLGRDKATREAMARAAKDGTLDDRLALGAAVTKDGSEKEPAVGEGAVNKFKAASDYEKLKAAEAKTGKKVTKENPAAEKLLGKVVAKSKASGASGTSSSGVKLAIMKPKADAAAILQHASERLAEIVKARNEALKNGETEKSNQLANEAAQLAADMKAEEERRAKEAVEQEAAIVDDVVVSAGSPPPDAAPAAATAAPKPAATNIPAANPAITAIDTKKAEGCGPMAQEANCKSPESCTGNSMKCRYNKAAWNSYCLDCDRDKSLYWKRLANNETEENKSNGSLGFIGKIIVGISNAISGQKKCYEVKRICDPAVMIPCNLQSGKRCTPTYKPGKCQDKTVEKKC
ncbi:MAG: hypothetical protein EOP11_11280 [Proteobacteria bacterium]|nr:MAG: hypothetical protein EOP11_11280 [Pseudomonadota bacterium]